MSDNEQDPVEKLMAEMTETGRPKEEPLDTYGYEAPGVELDFQQPQAGSSYVAQPAPGYDVHGLWHTFGAHQRTGYAAHAVAMHWMLDKVLGITTELIPHRDQAIDIDSFPDDRYDMLFSWMKSAVGHPHAVVVSYPPEAAMRMQDVGPNIVPYCAFEGTEVSEFCRSLCEGSVFARVWVVSEFVRKAFLAAGVSPDRVVTIRPPVCDGPWLMPPLAQDDDRPADKPFTFGVLGTWQKRKGMHDLVRAYFGAFKREENVQLVIRTSAFAGNATIREFKESITAELAEIARDFGDDDFPTSKKMPRLRFELGTEATDQQVIEWLAGLDCYANPSYGEGLGIPHVWAKANGVPMVTTGYGAVGDLIGEIATATGRIDGDPNVRVPHQLTPVDPEILRIALMFDPACCWGTYDPEDLGSAMRKAFQRGPVRDLDGAAYVRKAFSLEACAPPLRAALADVVGAKQAAKWKLR